MSNKIVSKLNTYLILIICFSLIGICILTDTSLFYGFLCGIIFSILIFIKEGYNFSELACMIINGLNDCKIIFLVILLMGATISVWLFSGIVPTIIYYGFEYIKNINYVLACFLISSVISIVMGTALGTISTVGIALIAIGKGFGIPNHILIGTIISGAFMADKISPISGLMNLTLKTVNIKYNKAILTMLKTMIPTYILTAVIYYYIGSIYSPNINEALILSYQKEIVDSFYISNKLLLFPLVIIVLAVLGIKITTNMSIGIIGGSLIGIILQKHSIIYVIRAIIIGYEGKNVGKISEVLKGGGIFPMIEVILIVMGAVVLSSLFEGTNLIKPIIDKFIVKIKNKGDLVFSTAVFSIVMTTLTCDQTVGILFPGKFLKRKYEKLGEKREVLARTILDSGIIIAPLTPWNVNSIIIAIIANTATLEYAPYAILCYISPVITILTGYISQSFKKNKKLSV
ncbi:MAG: sodium:proton antiporter [Firmicutes bacterium]|nr:sodium:proton antiporter [Bacillota bacterium]